MSNAILRWIDMPLKLNEKELQDELEKVGLTRELFEGILAMSPARQIVLGYPQEKIDALFIQDNW
jgi:hypothetical protein